MNLGGWRRAWWETTTSFLSASLIASKCLNFLKRLEVNYCGSSLIDDTRSNMCGNYALNFNFPFLSIEFSEPSRRNTRSNQRMQWTKHSRPEKSDRLIWFNEIHCDTDQHQNWCLEALIDFLFALLRSLSFRSRWCEWVGASKGKSKNGETFESAFRSLSDSSSALPATCSRDSPSCTLQ